MRLFCSILLLFFPLLAPVAKADGFGYAHAGQVAEQMLTYATSSGGLSAYYLGSTAGYENQIEVVDVQTGYNSGKILDNKTNSPGTAFTFGTGPGQINAGDQLIFYIDSPAGQFSSIASDSADGVNHAYFANYAGGTVAGQAIPAGVFVGMEDLPYGISDLNYNDDDFYVTDVRASPTPEPASLLLLATGVRIGFFCRRRKGVSKAAEV